MKFSDVLNKYMNMIGCTSKELSETSNISQSVISRYKNGETVPNYNSSKYNDLIDSLIILANKKNITNVDIKKDFDKLFVNNEINFEYFNNNFNLLINEMKINTADISRYIGFDSSYLSKIKSGTRKPKNINDFIEGICKYFVKYYNSDNDKNTISNIINCKINEISDDNKYYKKLYTWISNNNIVYEHSINKFLKKLDDFDLNEYIKAIKFDTLKVPTVPYSFPKNKIYYGIDGGKQAQIDALKKVVLGKDVGDIFFCSNMPMQEMASDIEFSKKWMFGLALMLKKGLHLNIIHDLDRPFKEMMLGLESWIPLYMTGQISPYYFKNVKNNIYSNLDLVSNNVALSGECISNHYNNSKYYLTNKKEEIEYYKTKANLLLKKASPLMEIYKENNKDEFKNNVLKKQINGDRRNILYEIPIYTISDKLLKEILDNNNLKESEKKLITNYVLEEKKDVKDILKINKIYDEISILSKEEFEKNPICLSITKLFFNKKIKYTYKNYLDHIKLLNEFKINNKNYNYKIDKNNIFKNINIYIIKNKQVIISKENSPIIHFVIHHPKLINSIEKFEVQITDEKK